MAATQIGGAFDALDQYEFLNLTTFRRSGKPVTSPLWFVRDGERLYLTTFVETGKIKRLRANDRAEVAPATRGGTTLGPAIPARARFAADLAESERGRRLFQQRYGWQFRYLDPLFGLVARWNGGGGKRIYFLLDPA